MMWPPPYQLRQSRRAKRVGLRILAHQGLEVVVPVGFKLQHLPQVLAAHRTWIEHKLAQRAIISQPVLPKTIFLTAIEQTWQVCYQTTISQQLTWQTVGLQQLIVQGQTLEPGLCSTVLKHWLREQAKQHLIPSLAKTSCELKLPYASVTVGCQATRWGSCTAAKRISLNAALLLLPAHVVRYVLIHELCHTVHLNHAPEFWRLVAEFEPNFMAIRRDLRQLQHQLPAWLQSN